MLRLQNAYLAGRHSYLAIRAKWGQEPGDTRSPAPVGASAHGTACLRIGV